jgi:hypothetical protein
MGIVIDLIAALLFLVEGILTLTGKGDDLIICLNKPGAEQYNVKRARLIKALRNFVWATGFVIIAFTDDNRMVAYFTFGFVILSLVVLFTLNRTLVKHN